MPAGIDRIIKELEEQKRREGSLPLLLEFYYKLAGVQAEVGQRTGVAGSGLTSETVCARLEQGRPLAGLDELTLDWPLLLETFARVTTIFTEYPELFGEIPAEFRQVEPGNFLTPETVRAWFEGTEFPADIMSRGVGAALLRNIIHATVKPFLVSYATALGDLVNQENWRQRCCPVCGGSPDFAFLDMERGARWLVCCRCDTEWLFQRLQCPYCGTTDQNALAYFTDGDGLYRLYVCEQCKRYLKAIDLRAAKSEVLIPLERLLTLDMDRQAQEDGYSPGG